MYNVSDKKDLSKGGEVMKKVLVTGASGHVGNVLVKRN